MPAKRALRDTVLPVITRLPPLQRRAARRRETMTAIAVLVNGRRS